MITFGCEISRGADKHDDRRWWISPSVRSRAGCGWLTGEWSERLLNAEPGRYVAVAARSALTQPGYPGYQQLFSATMIEATEVRVEAGELAFMGELKAKASLKMSAADNAQRHYQRLLPATPPGETDASASPPRPRRSVYFILRW